MKKVFQQFYYMSSSSSSSSSVYDVVIIGAGVSGLAAAHEIIRRSKAKQVETSATTGAAATAPAAAAASVALPRVLILEANSRVGGRNFCDSEGTDLGSGYVGPTQDRIMSVVDYLGLKTYKVNTIGKTIQHIHGKSTAYDGLVPPLSLLGLLDVNNAMVQIDNLSKTVNIKYPHLTPNAEELDRITMDEWIRRTCWTQDAANMVKVLLNAIGCVEPCEMSLLSCAWYIGNSGNIKRISETKDGAQDSKVHGGTGRISLELAARLPHGWLQLNSPVRSIDYTNSDKQEDITVFFGDGMAPSAASGAVKAKTVIMAIPPVQQLRISYSPALHPNRTQALQHWPMGHIIKTFCFYEKPFWKHAKPDPLNGSAIADKGISVVMIDDSKPDGSAHAIMGFVLATEAQKWAEKTPEERRDALAQHYAKVFQSEEALKPIKYKEKVWADEKWVGGCYSGVPTPGTITRFPNEITNKAEIARNLFVAGTEAARVFVGYLDGAVESGERCARNALVRLGKLPESEFETMSRPPASEQMPYVEMDITNAERYWTPNVPQFFALCGSVAAAAAVGVFVAWKLKSKHGY